MPSTSLSMAKSAPASVLLDHQSERGSPMLGISSAAVLGCLLAAAPLAHASVINFDDIALNVSYVMNVPDNHGGFVWGEIGDPDLYAFGDTIFTGAGNYANSYNSPSGENAVSNYAGTVYIRQSSGAAFDFNGAFFSTFTIADQTQSDSASLLKFEGFNGATLVRSMTANLDVGYDWVQADLLGITSLRITGSNAIVQPFQTRWMMDDFTFNATPTNVPEPATLLLSIAGFGLIARFQAVKRRVG